MRFCFIVLLLSWSQYNIAQEKSILKGVVQSQFSKTAINNTRLELEENGFSFFCNNDGEFIISHHFAGEFVLKISAGGFITKRIPVLLDKGILNIGIVYLEDDFKIEKSDNLIAITDTELVDDEGETISTGLLQSTKDIFLRRAAFDFGQAFFRVRGYDSNHGEVLINGAVMNKLIDGRPQWNNWGGLNDITRNQEYTNGLEVSNYTFGGVLGNTNIDVRPSGMRPGMRISSSMSNRTYAGRIMATYNSGKLEKGLSYSLSGSRRWAKEGFISGTLYDAYSAFASLEHKINENNTFGLTGILASNSRGRSAAITEEVYELVGNKYNPYWGNQNGKIRNSRTRKIVEPILMFNHFYEGKVFNLTTSLLYQFGEQSKNRLAYFNAPNPDPTYYRYLPSFYINSPIGANFISANQAKNGFIGEPQLVWSDLYTANVNPENKGKAVYVLQSDVVDNKQISVSTVGNLKISTKGWLDFGYNYRKLKLHNFARVEDLLGADFHDDVDAFSNTQNDIDGEIEKKENSVIGYNYNILTSQWKGFIQFKHEARNWKGFLSTLYSQTTYQRKGLFKNERFPDNSPGLGNKLSFSNYGVKLGGLYKITNRHWFGVNSAYLLRAPFAQNVYINPRENQLTVPNSTNEKITSIDTNYFIRLPKLTGRITGFYSRFQNISDVNFFFVESGLGSDFVQEVLTDMDKLHKGLELGLEYELSSAVKLSTAINIGHYSYANNPNVSINFDTSGSESNLINIKGNVDLGKTHIKGYRLAQGPQTAISLGIEYRDPKYWWVTATTNYLADNYINISTISRTQSFLLNPETGEKFINATKENVSAILDQNPLESMYLLNLVGGKSWRVKGRYISLFGSINNVFNASFKTGGYEQSRNGNYEALRGDNLSGSPSFGSKYWYGYGRTYFLNLAISI